MNLTIINKQYGIDLMKEMQHSTGNEPTKANLKDWLKKQNIMIKQYTAFLVTQKLLVENTGKCTEYGKGILNSIIPPLIQMNKNFSVFPISPYAETFYHNNFGIKAYEGKITSVNDKVNIRYTNSAYAPELTDIQTIVTQFPCDQSTIKTLLQIVAQCQKEVIIGCYYAKEDLRRVFFQTKMNQICQLINTWNYNFYYDQRANMELQIIKIYKK